MPRTYIALPHQLTSRAWMVFNLKRCCPVASNLSPRQARTLAEALNEVVSGIQPPAQVQQGDAA
jgi:hypothetical protein